ncbi:hypothetical protein PU560_15730 [Georgenia sp. 10Sc9-8]|uniref:Uncharacterized protein n=1 Tax=Georgenia halotolerans TaxID=3028317 RepID=A0ABT5U0P7_9MICO|nr:hypothetical protein [Georgenia halotolerans]
MSELSHARAAKEDLVSRLRGCPDVVGVGLRRSAGGYCIQVNLCDETVAEEVPHVVDGVEVRVTVVGRISAEG